MNVDRAREAGIVIASVAWRDARNCSRPAIGSPMDCCPVKAAAFQVNRSLKTYRFDEAASVIYQFFWGDFCDWYLEMVKLRLDFADPAKRSATIDAIGTLLQAFESTLRLLSPFMPFLTEELWHAIYGGEPPGPSIALMSYPITGFENQPHGGVALASGFGGVLEEMDDLQRVAVAVRRLRKDRSVPEKEHVTAHLYSATQSRVVGAVRHGDLLRLLARVSSIDINKNPLIGPNIRSESDFDVSIDYEPTIDVPAERERLTKELAKLEKALASAERQLSNQTFLDKAPPHIVDGLRKAEADNRLLIEKTRKAIEDLR